MPRNQCLTVAIADINDIVALDRIRGLAGDEIEIDTLLAGETEIDRAIDQCYGYELSIDGILHEIETGEIDFRGLQSSADEYSQPVVRLIDSILTDAVKRDSSDIHFEPEASFLRIRYRIDGMLRQIRSLHKTYWPAMAVRIKVLSGMNIAETRAPQDGRISLNMRGRQVDFRVRRSRRFTARTSSCAFSTARRGSCRSKGWVLPRQQLDQLKLMIARPEGIILVTGPTGSGKTTTLYSVLNHINSEGVNIMTLEDPVEYPMTLVRQTSAAESVKLDFANGIRSMMRQDPDIILVGEVRDADTAEMALRAAMTGHQVYSTLHTNSAIGAIPRLLDIGILPDIMAGNIIGIIAQRLVRRLCMHCKIPYQAEAHELACSASWPMRAAAGHLPARRL
jgi:type II secretory ATPase GspE/PulE/Tfp pilus assembly ATPase PilB-like protein